jgi:glycerophosphoryl diester phosphodiesterase
LLLRELHAFGYSREADPAFVQCFDAAELARVKHELGSRLRLIQLVGPGAEHAALLTSAGLRRVAAHAYGLGPRYSQLVEDEGARRPAPSSLARAARDVGLRLHPYTFRRDELPPYAQTLEELLEFFTMEVGVDGVFCDHPDVAVRVRERLRKVQ